MSDRDVLLAFVLLLVAFALFLGMAATWAAVSSYPHEGTHP